jgi:transposase
VSKARLIITAVIIQGRSQADVAREYNVSKGWVSKLVARYRTEGAAGFEPHSRRPRSHPTAIPVETRDRVLTLRDKLATAGLDAGPHTISWHLEQHYATTVSPATVWRTLHRAGTITPQPHKRPKSSYIRFEAALPNETLQSDFLTRESSRRWRELRFLEAEPVVLHARRQSRHAGACTDAHRSQATGIHGPLLVPRSPPE